MPRVLPCTHTYCHMCLTSLAGSCPKVLLPQCDVEVSAISCPKGCGSTPVGSAGAGGLPPNNVLISRLGRFGDRDTACCDECEGKVAADIWCDNCDAYFCKSHFSAMHQSRVGRRHRVAKAAERPVHKQARCTLHAGQDIVLYCRTCSEAVCRDCCSEPFHGNHASCEVVPIEVAADDAAGTIRDAVKGLRGQLLTSLREAAGAVQVFICLSLGFLCTSTVGCRGALCFYPDGWHRGAVGGVSTTTFFCHFYFQFIYQNAHHFSPPPQVQLATLDTISHTRMADIDKAFKYAEANVVAALRERHTELQTRWQEASVQTRQTLSSQAEEIGAAAVGLTTACGETEMELRANSAAALRRAPQLQARLSSAKEQAQLCRLEPMEPIPTAAQTPSNELATTLCQIIQTYGPMPNGQS